MASDDAQYESSSKKLALSFSNNSSFLDHVIEISSDSEDDVFRQLCVQSRANKRHDSRSAWNNDVIELTDSESSDSSNLPNMLSPLVKGPHRKETAGSQGQQSPSKKFLPLYADTSDEEESDKDGILVLNDPPGSRKPLRNITPAKDIARSNPSFGSPRKNVVPEDHQAVARKLPSKRVIYDAKEQALRQKYATELFAKLNKDVFGERLPKDTALEWSKRLLTTAGRARWHRSREGVDTTKIELASKILDCDERIRNTLAHEMCHLACWVIDNNPREGHGQLFKSWANKVMWKHPEIHISTRHNYEITYPYEWGCENCSKTYGRYSKSIRPDECVCGVCKVGKLIPLFVERKPKTPKISRMAAAMPRDSPHPKIGSLAKTGSMSPPSVNLDGQDIQSLVNAIGGISMGNATDSD